MTLPARVALFLLTSALATACQAAPPAAADPDEPGKATFASLAAKGETHSGLFTFHRDAESGALYMVVRTDQLDQDFLWFGMFRDGIAATGSSRGSYAIDRVLRLHVRYDKVEFQQPSTSLYFDPASPLARTADANAQPAVLAVAEVVDRNDAGDLLISVDPVFLGEALYQIKPTMDPKAEPGTRYNYGELNPEKTALRGIRAYPENVNLLVNYVYDDPAPLVTEGPNLVDPRAVGALFQHSLVAMPDNNYQPRRADSRVGYFQQRVDDMTDQSATPWRDLIQRWHLVKKNPSAALSDPVQPIVYWIENSTPLEYRDTVREAVLRWNEAFASAGISNAVEVRQQPDDARWDAGDLRYNVLRWTSSDESPWGGYGPSWVNPRSGEILGTDIMLEQRYLTVSLRYDSIYDGPANHRPASNSRGRECQFAKGIQGDLVIARALAAGADGSSFANSAQVQQALYELVLHEVGHTLGLSHNFIASTLLSPAQLHATAQDGSAELSASVMDYAPANFAPPDETQGGYFQTHPGRYDHWAITYGYSTPLTGTGAAAEDAHLAAILARSTDPGLALALDADVMAGSDSGIDPRAQMFDFSSDPLAYAAGRLDLIEAVSSTLLERFSAPGSSWQMLYLANQRLMRNIGLQGDIASRWIGGVHVDHARQGQANAASQPFQPVALEQQQSAMNLLRQRIFSPDAFASNSILLQHLQQQRRGWDQSHEPQDPQVHAAVLAGQSHALDHLLHPVTQNRILDSSLYGNRYSLNRMLLDLTAAIFADDLNTPVNSRRQQLQHAYVARLLGIQDATTGAAWSHASRAGALANLRDLQAMLGKHPGSDRDTQIHRAALLHLMATTLDQRTG